MFTQEEVSMCGVFAVYGTSDAAALTALGLQALQHRGQEGTGISVYDGACGESFHTHKSLGLVGDVFGENGDARVILEQLRGSSAIGQVRYSTHGQKERTTRNLQPIFTGDHFGGFAIAHNGELTNADILRDGFVADGAIFNTSTDTEVVNHLVVSSEATTFYEALVSALNKVTGAYSIVAITSDSVIGIVDPYGVRPLVLGKLGGEKIHFLASETCALDMVGATYVRDVEPGEAVILSSGGVESTYPFESVAEKFCIFEYVYFSRPDGQIRGREVYTVRKAIGAELAREHPISADIVVPVPDSGVVGGLGYAEQLGMSIDLGIIRNHYVGRTFIEPVPSRRGFGVRLKLNAVPQSLKGKRVILVDDSIVRATTAPKIVEMLRRVGTAEIHMRVASPPISHSCFYGIDTPDRRELIASHKDLKGIREVLGVDSLEYLSLEGLHRAVGNGGFCDACFSGNYPLPIP